MRMKDDYYMNIAINEAQKAYKKDEIPVGVVIVKNDKIVAKGYNKRNKSNKVKDHAEIIAIDKANRRLRNWRLEDCEIYITLEPCPMCASAIEQARIKRIITGAVNKNNETNNISSVILKNKEWTKGVQKELCTKLLNDFFKNKR
ncbi:MAG: nucleoside deaminase [Bacilli bacterium]|nr:nucleoside deaminase [Bacilli bacterium]